ncbi:hypothetical protein [Companilactobacillus kimchiensis]|uniref:Cell surface protein n=1 Tax=Companilactobacillus kimchiensis TaxID=993692 RepID=A0A0R2LBL3_9LACO|nr:hypothetical protein [Companilactobacillus kimchiensis]KRN96087.1 cell surface protein precursor [Companilactobacillus kimchiensis]
MRKQTYLKIFFGIFFTILLTILGPPQTIYADNSANPVNPNTDGIDDGVSTTWYKGSVGQSKLLTLNKGLSLGYAFGLVTTKDGQYSTSNQDDTVNFDSENVGDMNTYYSKMNTFLVDKYNNQYISSTFQGNVVSTDVRDRKKGVSMTSPDFIITQPGVYDSVFSRTMSVLGNGFSNKGYYYTDDKDSPAYLIVGNFNRGTYNFTIEIILRPSPTNRAIIQREMYVKNNSGSQQQFQVLFGEDTKLGINANQGADSVPIYDLGNKRGLYIATGTKDNGYKLSITNEIQDGFQHYAGMERKGNSPNWGGIFKPNGTGAEVNNNPAGTNILSTQDSAYSLRWDTTTLPAGKTAHFASTIGEIQSPYSLPIASKSYTNETRSDGTNKVGDKLKFTLHLVNNGYDAQWNSKEIVDQVPKGLQVDTSSIKRTTNGVQVSDPDPSDFDATSRKLTIPMPFQLTDDKSETVTFEATLTKDALQNLDTNGKLTNSADFTGSDQMISPNEIDSFTASVSFPVSAPSYNNSFTKQIKNITNNEDYRDSTTGKPGDRIGYQIIYSVAKSSQDHLLSATTINDNLPAGLTLDKSSIETKSATGDWYDQPWGLNTGTINEVAAGQQVTMRFEVDVSSPNAGILTNNAYITGVKTSGNETYDKQISNDANLEVQKVDGFIQTPTSIDFGSTNMYGKSKTLSNVGTDGELIVAHPDNNNFKVNVSYDNTSTLSQMINQNGDTIPTDNSGLIFIRQRTNSSNDVGTWQPILPTGTPIQTNSFAGNQQTLNLTDYVGVNDWQLKLTPATKEGSYNGTLTWSLNESV